MATFVVETYVSRAADGEPDAMITRVASVADEITAAGVSVRYLRSIFIPDQETCLRLFEADSAEAVSAVAERAGVEADRIAPTQSHEP